LNSGTAFEIEVTALSDSTATFNRDGILAATSSVIHNIVAGNSISGLTVVNSVYGSNTIIGKLTTMFSMPEECSPKTTTSAPTAAVETAAWDRLAVAVATAVDSKRKP
jgi:hypothetical protein